MKYLILTLLALAVILPLAIQDAYALESGIALWLEEGTPIYGETVYKFEDNYIVTLDSNQDKISIELYSDGFNENIENLYNDLIHFDELMMFTAYSQINTSGFSQILFQDCMIEDLRYNYYREIYYTLNIDLICQDEVPIPLQSNYIVVIVNRYTDGNIYTILWNDEYYLAPTNPVFEDDLVKLSNYNSYLILDIIANSDGINYYLINVNGEVYRTYTLNAAVNEMSYLGPIDDYEYTY